MYHRPTKGPKAKAQVSIGKKCDPGLGKDCPACFPASTVPLGPISCSTGQPMPDRTEGLTLATGQSFYCIEAGALTPTPEEAKCEDRATKEAVKFVGALTKCTDKCTKNAQAGNIAYDACARANGAPGVTPNDPDTLDCIVKGFDKFAEKINGVASAQPCLLATRRPFGPPRPHVQHRAERGAVRLLRLAERRVHRLIAQLGAIASAIA